MSSGVRGKSTSSAVEVTGTGRDGLWVLYEGGEYYIPFEDYPVFQTATVKEIYSIEAKVPGQLRWESIDCDIEVAALETPERYPLVFAK